MTDAPTLPAIAVADNLALDGSPRTWPAPNLLADMLSLDAVIPKGAHGALVAYGERSDVGKIGASLALLVRGPFGLTFMGRVDHSYTKPLKASIMLAKVF